VRLVTTGINIWTSRESHRMMFMTALTRNETIWQRVTISLCRLLYHPLGVPRSTKKKKPPCVLRSPVHHRPNAMLEQC